MIRYSDLPSDSVGNWCRQLLGQYRDTYLTFEEMAQVCTERIFDSFRQDNGDYLFAMVRIFRLCQYDELFPALQAYVTPDDHTVMVLMGTTGLEEHWNHRDASQGHRVISAVHSPSPMVSAALRQIGLSPGARDDSSALGFLKGQQLSSYFYVPDSFSSAVIPDNDFVQQYSIHSALGIGTPFASGAGFLMVAFTRIPFNEEDAQNFAQLSPFIGTLLANFDYSDRLWVRTRMPG